MNNTGAPSCSICQNPAYIEQTNPTYAVTSKNGLILPCRHIVHLTCLQKKEEDHGRTTLCFAGCSKLLPRHPTPPMSLGERMIRAYRIGYEAAPKCISKIAHVASQIGIASLFVIIPERRNFAILEALLTITSIKNLAMRILQSSGNIEENLRGIIAIGIPVVGASIGSNDSPVGAATVLGLGIAGYLSRKTICRLVEALRLPVLDDLAVAHENALDTALDTVLVSRVAHVSGLGSYGTVIGIIYGMAKLLFGVRANSRPLLVAAATDIGAILGRLRPVRALMGGIATIKPIFESC